MGSCNQLMYVCTTVGYNGGGVLIMYILCHPVNWNDTTTDTQSTPHAYVCIRCMSMCMCMCVCVWSRMIVWSANYWSLYIQCHHHLLIQQYQPNQRHLCRVHPWPSFGRFGFVRTRKPLTMSLHELYEPSLRDDHVGHAIEKHHLHQTRSPRFEVARTQRLFTSTWP